MNNEYEVRDTWVTCSLNTNKGPTKGHCTLGPRWAVESVIDQPLLMHHGLSDSLSTFTLT